MCACVRVRVCVIRYTLIFLPVATGELSTIAVDFSERFIYPLCILYLRTPNFSLPTGLEREETFEKFSEKHRRYIMKNENAIKELVEASVKEALRECLGELTGIKNTLNPVKQEMQQEKPSENTQRKWLPRQEYYKQQREKALALEKSFQEDIAKKYGVQQEKPQEKLLSRQEIINSFSGADRSTQVSILMELLKKVRE